MADTAPMHEGDAVRQPHRKGIGRRAGCRHPFEGIAAEIVHHDGAGLHDDARAIRRQPRVHVAAWRAVDRLFDALTRHPDQVALR